MLIRFCFPALKPSSAYTVSMNVALGDLKDSCITTKVETYLSDPQHFSKPFFTVKEKDEEEEELTNEVICFLDPSHLANHPSWLLRNILMLFTYQKLSSPFKVLCCRQMSGKLDDKNSMMLEVSSLDKTHSSFAPGWETDHQGHKAPRKINLQTHFNPERLSEDAVNLNIKLMLWRAAPDLELETLFQTRCLLIGRSHALQADIKLCLGMGTLGCAVARCLLGWGITHLTLIDSGLVSFSNPVRQSLYDFEDCLDGGKSKALAAVDHLKKIYPSANVKGYQLKVPMPGHPPLTTNDCKNVELLHQLVDDADVLFLLTDNRESRWLPTVLGSALRKVVINAALAFDSYLVMRHGQLPNSDDSTSSQLGCYFCNDVVAPGDSMSNRTLDQQCTVVRPGLAPIAGALAVELMVSLLHHPSGGQAPVSNSPLGSIPHMIRGSLSNFTQLCMTTPAFHQCIACSPLVAKSYLQNPLQFVTLAVHDEQYLQNLTGLTELINQTSGALQDWEINDTESESDTAFLCYALKSGDLRIISRISNGRALFSTHNEDITCVCFMNGESNRLLIASLDQKISVMEVWEKDEDIEYQVLMSVGVDLPGSIRVAWGPQSNQLFIFSLQNWVVFVQYAKVDSIVRYCVAESVGLKVLEGYEGEIPQDGVQCDISLCSEAPTFAQFLKFDAEVSFLRCHKNALIVGTTDGLLQIWNFTNRALQTLFSEADPEISDPIIKLQVDEGAPVRHVELLEDGLFTEDGAQDSFGFCFLTVSYPVKDRTNCITIKSWFCENHNTVINFHPQQIHSLYLTVESVEDLTSLSVNYCKRENLLIFAERHWTHLFVIRCSCQETYLGFDCISKFPLKQEIVSMEHSEDLSLEDGVENGIDLFCMQPMIVQQYILDADLCLPEVLEEEPKVEGEKPEGHEVLPPEESAPVVSTANEESSVLLSLMTEQQGALLQQSLVEMENSKPETMPIPVPESFDLELSISQPPDPSQSSPLDPTGMSQVISDQELGLQVNFKTKTDSAVVTPHGSSSGISLNEGSTPQPPSQLLPTFNSPVAVATTGGGMQSPKESVHSRTRSDKLEVGSSVLTPTQSALDSAPEPPTSVAQDITAVAMHLLKVSQAGGSPETPLGGKEDSRSEDHGLLSSERTEKESPVLQNLGMMDPGGLPMNSDLSDLVDTLERSLSNVKRMIQVLEHKLGRAFYSVNKRLDVNFQDTLSRLDSLQSSGIRGQEDRSEEVEPHHHSKIDGFPRYLFNKSYLFGFMCGLHISSFHNEEREVLRNRGEDTRQRIREAEKRNAVEREKKEKQGYHRRSHQVGKLMAEENEARLAQMSKDANDRHQLAKDSIERNKKTE
eukprot:g2796.t1